MKNYRILDARGCGTHKQGDVVEGHQIGDENGIRYLLKNEIIEETEDAVGVALPEGAVMISANAMAESAASLQGKIDAAVADAVKPVQEELDAIAAERDILQKSHNDLKEVNDKLQEKYDRLKERHEELKTKHEELKAKKNK